MTEFPAFAFTLATVATLKTAFAVEDASGAAAALEELFRSGGILSASFAVAWYFLKRSDNREGSIRKDLEKELREERASHEVTRTQLMASIRDLAKALGMQEEHNKKEEEDDE